MLFMDMVESTRLLQQLGNRYVDLMADYRRIVRAAFQQWNGHEVDTQGDAFFVVFARASDAATATVAIQRVLAAHRWPEAVAVQARIGLHTGEPQLSSEGYIGLDVHHAARIMSAGHPGQILLSQTTHDLVKHALLEDMSLYDLGEHRLKDLRQPSRLFQLSSADLPNDFPPLKTLDMLPWNVPFRRNPFFTGRTSLLERLHERLNGAQNQPLALNGLGGIGKTQTAVEYAFRYRDEYRAVLWVRAASLETLVTDYVSLASVLTLPGQDASDQMAIVAAVKRWMAQNAGWLLILDNADELPLLPDFLPDGGQGRVLLTTRSQATGKFAESLSVEKMEVNEGLLLLLRRAKLLASDAPLDKITRTLREQAQAIVEELDGLPLALDQAAAYIEETGCRPGVYLDLYQQRRSALLKRQSSISADYPHTVANTWSLCFQQVEQADTAAADLLRLCSFLDPDAIPEAMLMEGSEEVGPVLGPVVADTFLLNEAIQTLRRYSLIKRDPEARLLNVHRLVQVVLKDGLNEQTRRQWAERTVRAVNAAFPEVSFETWSRCELCLPHVHACTELIGQYQLSFPEAARLLHQAGVFLRDRGLYEQAEPLLQRALTMNEQITGSGHPETARSLNDLAWLYYHQGRYEQAEALYQRALVIREQVLGAHHPDTATTLNDLALLYENQGKYEQAGPLLERALTIREEVLGSEHLDVGESLNNLAILYYLQGKYEQAAHLLQRALTIRERVLGPEHPVVAESLNNLASLYRNQRKYEQAEHIYQRALGIREKVLGTDHALTALTLDNLGLLYQAQGKYEQAESLHQRALAIFEQMLGTGHPDTAIALHNLAQLYHSQSQYEQARSLYQRALAIFEQVLGPEHSRVAQSLHNLAQLSCVIGEYEQARLHFQRALEIREQALGSEHPDTIRVREDYNELLHTLHDQTRITRQLGNITG
jgi:tetratricopeptide (TPR) repeat protein